MFSIYGNTLCFFFIRTKFIRTLGFKSSKIYAKNIGKLHFSKDLRTLKISKI